MTGTGGNAGREVWGWSNSDMAERWIGDYATKEEAIDDAEANSDHDVEIWVAPGQYTETSSFLRADLIIERAQEMALDESSFEGGDLFEVSEKDTAELQALLGEWAKRLVLKGWEKTGRSILVRVAQVVPMISCAPIPGHRYSQEAIEGSSDELAGGGDELVCTVCGYASDRRTWRGTP